MSVILIDEVIMQGDSGIIFSFDLANSFEELIKLDELETYINIRRGKRDSLKHKCDVVDTDSGRVEYVLTTEDLSIGGIVYTVELELHYPDGSILTSQERIEFFVEKQIA